MHELSLKHSSTKNVKAKAEMAKRNLNMEATRQWKFLLKIYEICHSALSADRKLSVDNKTSTLRSGGEIDFDQLLIIASPFNQQQSAHIPKS